MACCSKWLSNDETTFRAFIFSGDDTLLIRSWRAYHLLWGYERMEEEIQNREKVLLKVSFLLRRERSSLTEFLCQKTPNKTEINKL